MALCHARAKFLLVAFVLIRGLNSECGLPSSNFKCGPGTCSQGQFQLPNGTCQDCFKETYMSLTNHNCASCQPCTQANTAHHEVEDQPCTLVHGAVIKCDDGYYCNLHHHECEECDAPCRDNQEETHECAGSMNRKCRMKSTTTTTTSSKDLGYTSSTTASTPGSRGIGYMYISNLDMSTIITLLFFFVCISAFFYDVYRCVQKIKRPYNFHIPFMRCRCTH